MYINSSIGMNKIRFNILNDIFEPEIRDKKHVNFFIDGHMLLAFLFRDNLESEILNTGDPLIEITNSFISIIEHYRKYLGHQKKDNNFYIIFNTKIPTYQASVIPYGNMFFDRYSKANSKYYQINTIIEKSMEFLSDYLKNVPHAYLVNSQGIEDTWTIDMLKKNDEKSLNVMFTKNTYWYQLIDKNTMVLRPKKKDESFSVTHSNIWNALTADKKYDVRFMDYTLYKYFLLVHGAKALDIPPINSSFIKLIKLMDRLVEEDILVNDMSTKSFIRQFNNVTLGGEGNFDLLTLRSKVMIPNDRLTDNDKMKINSSLIDLYDMNALEEMNKYFSADNIINIYKLNESRFGPKKLQW